MSLFQSIIVAIFIHHCAYAQDISDPCIGSVDSCPPNAVCLDNKCQCAFGYVAELDGTNSKHECVPFRCLGIADCLAMFGPFVSCSAESDLCVCFEDYAPDVKTQKCALKLEANCSRAGANLYCGSNAICGQQKCRCMMGYHPADDQVHCDKFECIAEPNNCETHFGEHTECQSNGLCGCTKYGDIILDYQNQTCIKDPNPSTTPAPPPTTTTSGNFNEKENIISLIIGISAAILVTAQCLWNNFY